MDIHIFWDGPFTFKESTQFKGDKDFGVYQVYGIHPVYGDSVLLYIGSAIKQYFGERLSQHQWIKEGHKEDEMTLYVGRLAGKIDISTDEWNKQIALSENLLIHAHQPVYNTSNKNSIDEKSLKNVHVFNWEAYKNLFPEVSGKRFTCVHDDITEDHLYEDTD